MAWFWCTDFTGHYPVGQSALAWGASEDEAAEHLNFDLRKQGLKGDARPKGMVRLEAPTTSAGYVVVLQNGDY